MLDSLVQDFKLAFRSLRKRPGFTAAAVAVLALGIGLNAAIWSAVDGVLLRPLVYGESEELVQVWPEGIFFKRLVEEAREELGSLEGFSAFYDDVLPLAGDGAPERVWVGVVSPGHFDVLGRRPFLGRTFAAEEGRPGAAEVAILSHQLWQRRFGGDPEILGQRLWLDGEPMTIVGVMPADYQSLEPGWQLWRPLVINPKNGGDYWGSYYLHAVGRLGEGVSAEEATAELRAWLLRRWQSAPDRLDEADVRAATTPPLREAMVGDVRPQLLLLLVTTALVLLVACANVAHLLLARAGARRQEIALRATLGAGRWRVVRQLLTETTLLSLGGAVAGLILAAWGVDFLIAALPAEIPRSAEIAIDGRVLGFTFALALVTAWIAGLVPALRATRGDLGGVLREGTQTTPGRRGRRLNQALVAFEIAASVVLVVGAGSMLESLWRLRQVDPGFATEEVTAFSVTLPGERYSSPWQRSEYVWKILEKLEAQPGIEEVGAINILPLSGEGRAESPYIAEGHPVAEDEAASLANVRIVGPGYFETLDIPLYAGRFPSETDRADAPRVMAINHTLAEDLWPGENPIGKHISWRYGDRPPTFTVVGVVGDVHQHSLARKPQPEMYLPYYQNAYPAAIWFVVRTKAESAMSKVSHFETLRRLVWGIDDQVPIVGPRQLDEVVRSSTAQPRFLAVLLGTFAVLAVLLAAVGIYGVVAWIVTERTPEIGLRMALGAGRDDVVYEMMSSGLVSVVAGLVLGVASGWAASIALRSFLYGAESVGVGIFAAVVLGVAAVAVASTWLPALRASKVDPLTALRYE